MGLVLAYRLTLHEMMKRFSKGTRSAKKGMCEVDLVDPTRVEEARSALPRAEDVRRVAEAFRVLANPNRLRVLKALEGRELCVCDLREVLGVSMSGTSQILRELRSLGAVDYRTQGKLAYYRLSDPSWLELAETVLERFSAIGTDSR